MKPSGQKYFADFFSHIYVEEEAFSYPAARDILNRHARSAVIPVARYQDLFNRTRQSFVLQKQAPALILAVRHGRLVYPGAKVCQSFGNAHFYYASNVMNCVYDCEYCYLQGMYPSGNIVIFVNLQDFFGEVDGLLALHPVYLCISYDTDLLALEGMTGFVGKWTDFAAARPGLKLEIRTKSAYTDFARFALSDRTIFAWTLSPDAVADRFEHNAPPLEARLRAVKAAISAGCAVRLCFDPMIYAHDYKSIYSDFYAKVFDAVDAGCLLDVSLGLFRISADYLKNMRQRRAGLVTSYPYTNTDGVCGYEQSKADEMLSFARNELSGYIAPEKIFEI